MADDDLAPGYYDSHGTWHKRLPERRKPPGHQPVQQPELLFSGLGPTPEERREQRKRYVDEVLETFWISTSSRRAKARTTSVGAESSATRARGTVPGDGE